MNTKVNTSRGLVAILGGSAVAFVFCAAQAPSPVRNLTTTLLLQQDQTEKQQPTKDKAQKEKKDEKNAAPVRDATEQPGGSMGVLQAQRTVPVRRPPDPQGVVRSN